MRALSQVLKEKVEPQKRHDYLTVELAKMNQWIRTHIQNIVNPAMTSNGSSSKKLSGTSMDRTMTIKGTYRFNFHGLMLPLREGGQDDTDPYLLVRIIPELNQPFNTKQRAPFKFVCECIKYKELEEHEKLTQ